MTRYYRGSTVNPTSAPVVDKGKGKGRELEGEDEDEDEEDDDQDEDEMDDDDDDDDVSQAQMPQLPSSSLRFSIGRRRNRPFRYCGQAHSWNQSGLHVQGGFE